MEILLILWLTILFFGTVLGDPTALLWMVLIAAGALSVVTTQSASWLFCLLALLAALFLLKQWARR